MQSADLIHQQVYISPYIVKETSRWLLQKYTHSKLGTKTQDNSAEYCAHSDQS